MKILKNIQEFSRTPGNIQGQQDVFQESRTKRVLIANSRIILGGQGRLSGNLTGNPCASNCSLNRLNLWLFIRWFSHARSVDCKKATRL